MVKVVGSSSKKINALVVELGTFGDADLDVYISVDGGDTLLPADMVMKRDGKCVISYNPGFDDIRATLRSRRCKD